MGRLTTYDLVSHGPSVAGKNECHATWDGETYKGWGPAFQYACIHSGVIKTSGDLSTSWYNYVLASAGTIISENTTPSNPANNTKKATETICPKGWTLPNKTQIDSNRNMTIFSPVLGGDYYNGTLYNENTGVGWWGNEGNDGTRRYRLIYNGTTIYTGNSRSIYGGYIRCVQKST